MPVDGNKQNLRWVITGANGQYTVGSFDGRRFVPEAGPIASKFGYAVQTFSDIPPEDGRRIQIGWLRGGKYPDMPFNQQMTFPCELTLRSTPAGLRVHRMPVKEIELLRATPHRWAELTIKLGENPLAELKHDLYDIEAEILPGDTTEVGFNIFGTNLKAKTLNGRITLRLLVDRTSVEYFVGEGQESHALCYLPTAGSRPLELYAKGGSARVKLLNVYALRSAWPSKGGTDN
jgi:sucrose-6-phosphate hydrolase SacC (GH32 family)